MYALHLNIEVRVPQASTPAIYSDVRLQGSSEVQLAEGVCKGSLSLALHYHASELLAMIVMKLTNIYLTLTLCQLLLQIAYFFLLFKHIPWVLLTIFIYRGGNRNRLEDKFLKII